MCKNVHYKQKLTITFASNIEKYHNRKYVLLAICYVDWLVKTNFTQTGSNGSYVINNDEIKFCFVVISSILIVNPRQI